MSPLPSFKKGGESGGIGEEILGSGFRKLEIERSGSGFKV
jgi:hypothetical protein